VDSLQAVMSRINEIRSLTAPTGVMPPAQTPSRGTGSAVAFAAALNDAQRATTPAPAFAAHGAMTPAPAFAAPTPVSSGSSATSGVSSSRPISVSEVKATWQNGRLPESALVPLGHAGQRLAAPAAAAFADLEAAARADGISFRVTDSYRSFDEQVDMARRKGLYSEGGLAAKPGTSQHGWGLAVDLGLDARAQAWMRSNAGKFGFVEDVPREPWHWTFHGR
jgi:D-alanyl-D-alanine carboxypeptidase